MSHLTKEARAILDLSDYERIIRIKADRWIGYPIAKKVLTRLEEHINWPNLRLDELIAAGVSRKQIYIDHASGKTDDRPGLESCLKALRNGDTLLVWKLDRLGRNLSDLVTLIDDFQTREVSLKVLKGQGASIDTTTAEGKLVFGIFAALAEYERALISERTRAGLIAARARGRRGGRRHTMTPAKVNLAMAAMSNKETAVNDLCRELEIMRQTLYRYVSPSGKLRESGKKLLKAGNQRQRRR